jgi:hypothetical protein
MSSGRLEERERAMAKRRATTVGKRRKVSRDEAEVLLLLKQLARLPATPIAHDDVPTMVHRVEVQTAETGQSYEEANWAKLSPVFRKVHNQLRIRRGMSPIPDPRVDLYVPPKLRKIDKIDEQSPEAVAAMREYLRPPTMRVPGGQGFRDKGLGKDGWIE